MRSQITEFKRHA